MEALLDVVQAVFEVSDAGLGEVVARFRNWAYALVFAVVFCETGLVVAPFLPGDSLLFAAGTLAAAGDLSLWALLLVLLAAALLGDIVNYAVGRKLGRHVLLSGKVPFVKRRHVERTESFFARHGGKAVIIARFVPMGRTLAPFLAGAARMPLPRFWLFNLVGAVLWTATFTLAGYFFGTLPWVSSNLSLSMLFVVLVSLAPAAVSLVRSRRSAGTEAIKSSTVTSAETPEWRY
jgi:membrane-associated protein